MNREEMRVKYLFLMILISTFIFLSCDEKIQKHVTIPLSVGWKFINKDNLNFSKSDFDDAQWTDIGVDNTWNKQGFSQHEGFGWYRIKVVIPSSLKDNSYLVDSLIFHLGRIDDFDQVFLNGELIGQNLKNMPRGSIVNDDYKDLNHSFWNLPRRYALPVDDPRIKWDKKNVIAIRVYNWGGLGGIYSGDLYVSMPEEKEYVELSFDKHIYQTAGETQSKTLLLKNRSGGYPIKGHLSIDIINNINGRIILSKENKFHLQPAAEQTVRFVIPRQKQSS